MDLNYSLIAEKIFQRGRHHSSGEGAGDGQDLELAATVGKMLLEKNSVLEEKLLEIQCITEQTKADNDSLTRQVSALRDSLMAAGQISEQFEEKMEELEIENEELSTRISHRQTEMEKREAIIKKLEGKLEETEHTLLELKIDYRKVTAEKKSLEKDLSVERKKHQTLSLPKWQKNDDLVQLKEQVSKLVQSLRESNTLNDKKEERLEASVYENEHLELKCLQAEATVEDLRHRLSTLEETDGSLRNQHGSSMRRTRSMRHAGSYKFHMKPALRPIPSIPSDSNSLCSPHSSRSSSTTSPTGNPPGAVSLWSELDSQCSLLRERFDQWVDQCHCRAAVDYRQAAKIVHPSLARTTSDHTKQGQSPAMGGKPFKVIFEDLFASLRETKAVANKLLGTDEPSSPAVVESKAVLQDEKVAENSIRF